jgi:hypothetical protein
VSGSFPGSINSFCGTMQHFGSHKQILRIQISTFYLSYLDPLLSFCPGRNNSWTNNLFSLVLNFSDPNIVPVFPFYPAGRYSAALRTPKIF